MKEKSAPKTSQSRDEGGRTGAYPLIPSGCGGWPGLRLVRDSSFLRMGSGRKLSEFKSRLSVFLAVGSRESHLSSLDRRLHHLPK